MFFKLVRTGCKITGGLKRLHALSGKWFTQTGNTSGGSGHLYGSADFLLISFFTTSPPDDDAGNGQRCRKETGQEINDLTADTERWDVAGM